MSISVNNEDENRHSSPVSFKMQKIPKKKKNLRIWKRISLQLNGKSTYLKEKHKLQKLREPCVTLREKNTQFNSIYIHHKICVFV